MNRRTFTLAAMTPPMLILAGCDTDQKPGYAATVLHNADVQRALQSMESAISGLQGDVEQFDGENWRDVVPEVRDATGAVADAFRELREALAVAH